jgi:hypothetical protein
LHDPEAGNHEQYLESAAEEGILSPQSVNTLTLDPNVGARIQAALGAPVELAGSAEVVLVGMLVDDSGSIEYYGNTDAVRQGHNQTLEAMIKSKQADNIYLHTRLLNGEIVCPFTLLDQAPRLDSSTYDSAKFGGTPLYDQTVVFLGSMIAEAKRYRDEGVYARGISLIISDGADEHSKRYTYGDVAGIVLDMMDSEDHIVAALGIRHGHVDFEDVFVNKMGIDRRWVFTASSDPSEIRRAFQMVSQTAVRVSQSAVNFSKTKTQGWGGFA